VTLQPAGLSNPLLLAHAVLFRCKQELELQQEVSITWDDTLEFWQAAFDPRRPDRIELSSCLLDQPEHIRSLVYNAGHECFHAAVHAAIGSGAIPNELTFDNVRQEHLAEVYGHHVLDEWKWLLDKETRR